jgi:hypothetical protein
MEEHLNALKEGIRRWRECQVGDYWLSASYIGAAVNRFGDHDLTVVDGRLYHLWHGAWREIAQRSDFWLFAVPVTFAWARDLLTKELPAAGAGADAIELRFDADYGLIRLMRVHFPARDAHNFTYEVRHFAKGPHPDFRRE